MNMLCSDKTGTLTLNKMVIQVRRRARPAAPRAPVQRARSAAQPQPAPPHTPTPYGHIQEDTPIYTPGAAGVGGGSRG